MTTNFSRKSTRPDNAFGETPGGGRASAGAPQGLGAVLRERREAMGVSLAEVEVATRIRQKYLSALEADDWHLLPGEVVGRGFLRNYADYLGLDPQEAMDRRRAVTDANLTVALSTTSAGAPLPPTREVDYRPKEVDLKDEGDGIQRGEIRLTPILSILGVAVVVMLGWWVISTFREPIGDAFGGVQAGVTGLFDRPTATPTVLVAGVVNEQNVTDGATPESAATPGAATDAATKPGIIMLGSGTATAVVDAGAGGGGASDQPVLMPTATPAVAAELPAPVAEVPTATPFPPTPLPELPTATPVPPTPTPEPPTPTPEVLLPTATPTLEAPPVAAAACADPRSVISSPGVNQVLSGIAGISGSATHEAFQYYKLEFAPGANAAGGYVYFGGGSVQISAAFLGNFDTTSLANGAYTIRLTVVDQSGNFPPPCDVSVVIQN